eukprot:UN01944
MIAKVLFWILAVHPFAYFGYYTPMYHVYFYPQCSPSCLTNYGGCPNGNCHQVVGRTYKVSGTCYNALTNCWGCLSSPGSYPNALQAIACPSGYYPHYGGAAIVGDLDDYEPQKSV